MQTAYLNCGGDLNVPHGELFTTPLLTGTNGTLHVQDIYLRDVYFPDLILRFTDGYITDYACGGFDTPEAGRAYVREHLLQGHDTLTIGEFAIGSNTLAYPDCKGARPVFQTSDPASGKDGSAYCCRRSLLCARRRCADPQSARP